MLLARFYEPWKRGIPCRGISFIFKHHPRAFIASLWQFNAPLGGLNCLRSTNTTSRWQTNAPMDNYLHCPLVYIVNLLRTGLLCLCSHSHRLYRLLLRVYRCTVNVTFTWKRIFTAECTRHCTTKTEWSCDKGGPLQRDRDSVYV